MIAGPLALVAAIALATAGVDGAWAIPLRHLYLVPAAWAAWRWGSSAAGLVGLIAVAFPAVAPVLASDLFTAAIETLTRVAIPANALLSLAEQPTVPIAAIATLAVAIVHEYAQRRGSLRESTS